MGLDFILILYLLWYFGKRGALTLGYQWCIMLRLLSSLFCLIFGRCQSTVELSPCYFTNHLAGHSSFYINLRRPMIVLLVVRPKNTKTNRSIVKSAKARGVVNSAHQSTFKRPNLQPT
ncbi:hypothetical protein Droror1_Dr00016553 [Drosera rotundifolia]